MAKMISIHSFRRGTGKSNVTANITALLAAEGWRVGVVDTDMQSPSLHILFGLDEEETTHSLNDYLWGKCDIEQTAHDVTPNLGADIKGQVFLTPSSTQLSEITRVLREGYDVGLLNDGLRKLVEGLGLDVLMVDTHAGLNEETLLSIALSDALAIILRTDRQDYQGTGIMVEVARKLDVPRMVLIVNEVPSVFDSAEVKARVEQTYNCEVAAVLPFSDEMMALASAGIFVLHYSDHPLTATFKHITARLVA
jgi:MinD-like ATPase involved in chromosome partitioning or flagellar assembly